jgi:hypothetical protein
MALIETGDGVIAWGRQSHDVSSAMARGKRDGVKWAIEWLQRRAVEMNDPKATAILNSAAANMGWDAAHSEATGQITIAPE